MSSRPPQDLFLNNLTVQDIAVLKRLVAAFASIGLLNAYQMNANQIVADSGSFRELTANNFVIPGCPGGGTIVCGSGVSIPDTLPLFANSTASSIVPSSITVTSGTDLQTSGNLSGSGVNVLPLNPLIAGELHFQDPASANYVGFETATGLGTTTVWILPPTDGTVGQFLQTDGLGVLSWGTGGGLTSFADNVFSIYNNVDNTKTFQFDASNISPATQRIATIPDSPCLLPGFDVSNNLSLGSTAWNYAGATQNTVIGADAGTSLTTGSNNTVVGFSALSTTASGGLNVAVGAQSLTNNVAGSSNVGVGANSLFNNQADNCVAIGTNSLFANTVGVRNTAVGSSSASSSTFSVDVTCVGYSALQNNTADGNTAVGSFALQLNSSGTNNLAIGYAALQNNVGGTDNTAIGQNALNASNGNNNVAVGSGVLVANSSGSNNTGIGVSALASTTTGGNLTAIGVSALQSLTSGNGNTAIGPSCLSGLVSGSINTGIGFGSMAGLTSGNSNTAIGNNSLSALSAAFFNTAIGSSTGGTLVNGSNNLLLGQGANVSASGANNEVCFGDATLEGAIVSAAVAPPVTMRRIKFRIGSNDYFLLADP